MNTPLKILIAEDDNDVREMVAFGLSQCGYEVKTTGDGKEALDAFDDFAPDVVLTDYDMPRVNGLMLLRILKAKKPNVKVVFMSAQRSIEVAVNAMKLGACDFIPKPFDFCKLEETLSKALEVNSEALELKANEKDKILTAIRNTNNLEEAARILGICTETLWRKRKKYGLMEKKAA